GSIDDVMIFNRSLSAEEIIGLYANSSSKYVSNNFTGLAEGDHTFKAYSQDLGGNVNTTETRTITIDTTAPTINFVSPTEDNGTTITVDNTTINVSSTDLQNISTFIDFDNSLVSWWRMDDVNGSGDVVDYTGRNNGSAEGDALINSTGKMGDGLHLDGTGDYVDVGSFSHTIRTISAWVKPSSLASYPMIVARAQGDFDFAASLNGNGIPYAYNTDTTQSLYWDTTLQVGTWYHLVLTVDSTLGAKGYLNGLLEGNNSNIVSLPNTENLYIGKRADGYNFNGSIDDVMIFNRSLSADEIVGLYANTSSKYVSNNFTDLVEGEHTFKAYSQDLSGNVNSTETRSINVNTGMCSLGDIYTTCYVSEAWGVNNGMQLNFTNLVIQDGGSLYNTSTNIDNHGASFTLNVTGNFTIESGGNVTGGNVTILAGNLTLEENGTVSSKGLGWEATYGPGAKTTGRVGGGHGGEGGGGYNGITIGGTTYGSITTPTSLGSGGWSSGTNSIGGGAIILNITGDTIVNGTIDAMGTGAISATMWDSGGAGGSIYITTGELSGNGLVTVQGGTGGGNGAGSSGGGRISIILSSGTDFGNVNMTAYGGDILTPISHGAAYGAAGTIYLKGANQDYGKLIIDNDNISTVSTTLVSENVTGDFNFGNVTVSFAKLKTLNNNLTANGTIMINSSGLIQINSNSTFNITGGTLTGDNNSAQLELNGGTLITLGEFNYTNVHLNITSASTFDPVTSFTIGSGAKLSMGVANSFSGDVIFAPGASSSTIMGSIGENLTLESGFTNTITQNGDLDVTGNFNMYNGTWQYTAGIAASLSVTGNMYVNSTIFVQRSSTSGYGTGRNFTIGGNLTCDTGCVFNATGLGFDSANGPGSKTTGRVGGGHGGEGGGGYNGITIGGTTYGSITTPTSLGSGGWGTSSGYAGGGAIMLNIAGNTTINGTITTKGIGAPSYNAIGGGAGGSIYISSGELNGNGLLTAQGGAGGGNGAGSGAGGRISTILSSGTDFGNINFTAIAGGMFGSGYGAKPGAAGTIYLKNSNDNYGELIIDNNGLSTVSTTLISENVTDSSVGTVTIRNSGILEVNTSFTVYGDWNNTGNFSENISTINFVGDSSDNITIHNNESFYNLNITKKIGSVLFTTGSIVNVTNEFSVQGNSSDDVYLRSTVDGEEWLIDASGTQDVDYTDVKDSNASLGDLIIAAYSADSGNNVNWRIFSGAVDLIAPNISFVEPTENDSATIEVDHTVVNVSTSEEISNVSTFIDFDNSLVGWWRMDDVNGSGDPTDYMNRNNGTAVGDAVLTSDGKIGSAFSFDGAGDYVDAGSQLLTDNSAFTYSVWIKLAQSQAATTIVGRHNDATGGSTMGIDHICSNCIKFHLNTYADQKVISTTSLNDASWHHIVGTWDTTNLILYVDGILDVNGTPISTLTYPALNSQIGKWVGGNQYFNGSIDDVMIFNRSLSADEIVGLYANTSSKYVSNNFTDLADGAHTFKAYSQDLSGNVNSTELRTVTYTAPDTTFPLIDFDSPTPANATSTVNTSVEINVSIVEANLDEVKYNWNGTNFTMLNDSLVLMMNFDNVSALGENDTHVVDVSGNGNNGTVVGDGDEINATAGKYNGGLNLDGTGDYVDLGAKLIPADTDFSISSWINLEDYDSYNVIVSQYDHNPTAGRFSFLTTQTTGTLYAHNGATVVTSSSAVGFGWHYVALTRSGNTYTIYIDGTDKGSGDSATSIYQGLNTQIGIGKDINPFDGQIDEVRIWNRSLSADEVYQRYVSNLNKFNSTDWGLYVNQSLNATDGLADGDYTYFASAKDDAGNENITETRTVTIATADTTLPYFTTIPANASLEYGTESLGVDFDATDAVGFDLYVVDDSTNFSINSSGYLINATVLAIGSYQLNITINDSSNNLNSTLYRVVVNDTTFPEVVIVSPTATTYTSNSVSVNVQLNESGYCEYSLSEGSANSTLTANATNTGFTGTITGLANADYALNTYCNDSAGNVNYSESVNFTVSVAASVTTAPSSGGGGGGSSSIPLDLKQDLNLNIVPQSLEVMLVKEVEETRTLQVSNPSNENLTLELSILGELGGFVSVINELKINAGEMKNLAVKFNVPEKGLLSGKIALSTNGRQYQVPVILNVKSENFLFDTAISVFEGTQKINQGQLLKAQIDLLQVGPQEKVDVVAKYVIKDFEGNTYLEGSETFFVLNQKSYAKEFDTLDLLPGNYILGLELVYPGAYATASSQFQVLMDVQTKIEYFSIATVVALLLVALAFGARKMMK
ncbi:LamG domain-containing protein, partial [archaeon]|nr:LamG domain-containing protein [archaeon]MBT7282746.1 LamG domain-containing protein [archaeon]